MAGRLVQHQHQAGGRIERLAVDAHVGVRGRVVDVQQLAGRVGHAALAHQRGDVAAAAVAEVGEHPQQLHRGARPAAFTASTTLKPSRCATRRALPKLASSTDSYGRWRLATSNRRPPGLSTSAATAMTRRPMPGSAALPWAWNGGLVTMQSKR